MKNELFAYIPTNIHKDSIGENRARDLFVSYAKSDEEKYGDKKVIFEDRPLDFQREDAKFCVDDGNLCFFGGCGFDTLSALVEVFFEKYREKGEIPSDFTLKELNVKVSDTVAKFAPNVSDVGSCKVTAKADGVPYLYWQNHTCRPDETVSVLGINFENTSKVKIALLSKEGKPKDTREVTPILLSDNNIMFIIPKDMDFGMYEVKVSNSFGDSLPLYVNEPRLWWSIADRGEFSLPGGEIRFFGVGISFDKGEAYLINKLTDKKVKLVFKEGAEFSATYFLPKKIPYGEYTPYISNGLCNRFVTGDDTVTVKEYKKEVIRNINVTPVDDLKELINTAKEGDVLLLSEGEYTVKGLINLPNGLTLKGSGAYKTKVYVHGTVIMNHTSKLLDINLDFCNSCSGSFITVYGNGVRVKGCVISQNPIFSKEFGRGPGICAGIYDVNDVVFEDCEFYSYSEGMMIERSEWIVVRNCTFKTDWSGIFTRSSVRIVIENNTLTTVEIDGSASICPQVSGAASYFNYIANNDLIHTIKNDREAITYDDHGTVYFGRARVDGNTLHLFHNSQIFMWRRNKNLTSPYILNGHIHIVRQEKREWHTLTCTVMTGRGICQMRNVLAMDLKYIVLEKPFDITPSEDADYVIGVFNGKHIIINNTVRDAGSCVQTYPPNYESIVVGNKSIRGGSFSMNSRVVALDADTLNNLEPYRQHLDPSDSMLYTAEPNILSTLRDNVIENGNRGCGRENGAGINFQGARVFANNVKFDSSKMKMNADGYAETGKVEEENENPEGYTIYPTFGNTAKGNTLNTFAGIFITTATDSTVIEHNLIKDTKYGIKIGRHIIDGKKVNVSPKRLLIRKNTLYNVQRPLWDVSVHGEDPEYKPFND